MWEGESQEYKKGTSERRGSIYAARAAGPCEDANLTERHTRPGRTPFPDAATACSALQKESQQVTYQALTLFSPLVVLRCLDMFLERWNNRIVLFLLLNTTNQSA
jgi:hypothetical protein